jgi:hypothetical protein
VPGDSRIVGAFAGRVSRFGRTSNAPVLPFLITVTAVETAAILYGSATRRRTKLPRPRLTSSIEHSLFGTPQREKRSS